MDSHASRELSCRLLLRLQALIACSPDISCTCIFVCACLCVCTFIKSIHVPSPRCFFPNSVTKVSICRQRSLQGSVVSQGLSASRLPLFRLTKRKPSTVIIFLQAADTLALLVMESGNALSVSVRKDGTNIIDTASRHSAS